jgi:TPR repeat protein
MARNTKLLHVGLGVSGLLLTSLTQQGFSEDMLNPESAIKPSPSRCYWLERGVPDEGLCGQKMQPDIDLMKTEAEAGNAFAAFRLGQLYSSGTWGVERDEAQARHWYAIAAQGGEHAAQVRMARAYELGLMGLEPDLRKAIHYYEMAVEQGLYPDLEERLENLRRLLPAE